MTPLVDQLPHPIVLAPLAGGPSTPRLTAAVSGAGGLGFLAAGYLSPDELRARIGETRELTTAPFGVNVFVPGSGPTPPKAYRSYLEGLANWARDVHVTLGQPRYSDDGWEAKLELLRADPPAVVSFTFGCPDRAVVDSLRQAGAETWVTVTSPEEARVAAAAGADGLVVQGAEAGGHRGSFVDRPGLATYGLLPLIALVREATELPIVASGGLSNGAAVVAALCAGACAAQLGTAFLLAPEAGTSAPHRAALRSSTPTVLTRAFTGRLARGIRNRFTDEHDREAPVAYPELHYVTAPMRRAAREAGDPELVNLWAGEAHALAAERPAAEIVERLASEARTASARAAARYGLSAG